MKIITSVEGFSNAIAKLKCEENGGFLAMPMNEMYTKDIEDYISSDQTLASKSFWIGKAITVSIGGCS